MSPTEDQLRRALREGEGPGPDPDTVILRAAAYRGERRTRIRSAVAVAAVVAGIGTGIGFLATSNVLNNEQHHNASRADASTGANFSAKSAESGQANGGGTAGSGVQAAPEAPARSATACPARLPPVVMTSNTTTPLFDGSVSSVTVCGYQGTGAVVTSAGAGQPLSRTFRDADAAAIAHAAATAPTASIEVPCGVIPATGLHALLLLATYASGVEAKPVVVGVGCDTEVTNGTTTRYSWTVPAQLTPFLQTLQSARR